MWSVLAYIQYPKQNGTFQRWNYTHTHTHIHTHTQIDKEGKLSKSHSNDCWVCLLVRFVSLHVLIGLGIN